MPLPMPGHPGRQKPPPMPEIVKQHFTAKPGYVNYYFNQVDRDRVWNALVSRGDYAAWNQRLDDHRRDRHGRGRSGSRFPTAKPPSSCRPASCASSWPAGCRTTWSRRAAAGCWCRCRCGGGCWSKGPKASPSVLPGHGAGCRTRRTVSTCWWRPTTTSSAASCSIRTRGSWWPMEMSPAEDVDPCELFFSDYREVGGLLLPGRIEVRARRSTSNTCSSASSISSSPSEESPPMTERCRQSGWSTAAASARRDAIARAALRSFVAACGILLLLVASVAAGSRWRQ